jgi:trk system potassium uptake protein TrkA
MIELDMKKEWIGKNLLELNFRKKYSLNVIAIKENDEININIDPNVPLNDNMKLIVIGNRNKIKKLG